MSEPSDTRGRTGLWLLSGPFWELHGTFTRQLFSGGPTHRSVDARQRAFWLVALLLPPGTFLLISLLPEYEFAVLSAIAGHGRAGYVDDLLAWIVFLFTSYAMATSGAVAVLSWDGLTFERTDGMVLGPLPVSRRRIGSAKLSALTALFLVGAVPINLVNATVFAMVTAQHAKTSVLLVHFSAFLAATLAASAMGFAAVVLGRAFVSLVAGPRLAAACAAPLQFLFVVALCGLLVFCPFVLDVSFASATFTNWLPSGWFVGVFEVLRGSVRAFDPAFPFRVGAFRASIALSAVMLGAITLSTLQMARQMSASIGVEAGIGWFESAPIARFVARRLTWRDQEARGYADFAVLTMARNGAQRGVLAVSSGLGVVTAMAALAHGTNGVADLTRPRLAILWIPLVAAYCTAAGVRAALRTAGENMPSWAFHVTPSTSRSRLRGARAAMAAFVLPRTLCCVALLCLSVSPSLLIMHAAYVSVLSLVIVHAFSHGAVRIPFAQSAEGGETVLKGRWLAYGVGILGFAYLPVLAERAWTAPIASIWAAALAVIVWSVVNWLDRREAVVVDQDWGAGDDTPFGTATTLDLTNVAPQLMEPRPWL